MLKKSDPHTSVKATVAFIIVVVAFTMLYVFESHKENILYTGGFQPFLLFTFLGFSSLLTLLYLVNKSGGSSPARKTRSRKRK